MQKRGPTEAADLDIVCDFFRSHGLSLQRFSKAEVRAGQTPDFQVLLGDELVAFCEVKSPRDDWLDGQLYEAEPGEIVGGARNDPVFNRLSRMIEKAASQFDAVNQQRQVPNILFFVNHADASNYGDLRETLTGFFFAEGGAKYPTSLHVSQGKIREVKFRIDAYAWYDVPTHRLQGWMLSEHNLDHRGAICAMFGLDELKILR